MALGLENYFENSSQLTKIFELAFLLCKCIPCKCATSSSKRYQVYVQLRAQVFVIIDEIFVLEPATVVLHRIIFKNKIPMFSKILEITDFFENFEFRKY